MIVWYSFVYGFGALVIALFTYTLYKSNPSHEANIYFSSMGLSAFIWIFSEFLFYTFNGSITIFFYIIKYAGICMVSYAVLMSSLTTPIRMGIMKVKNMNYYLMIPPLISVLLIITFPQNHLFFTGFKEIYAIDGKPRYIGIWGPAFFLFHIPYSYIYLSSALIITTINLWRSRTKIDKILSLTLFTAIVVPFIANVIVILHRHIYPDPTSLALIFSASLMTYVLSKYRMFSLEFQTEESAKGEKIEFGKNYLIGSPSSYMYFRNIAADRPGLIITTRNPDWVRENFNIEKTPIIWITEVSHPNAIRPERLEFEIEYSAIEFIRENKGGIVFLDGIGYLSAFQKFDEIHKFLKDILDTSSLYDGTVIVNGCDLILLSDEERKEIESLFDEVLPGEKVNLKNKIIYVYSNLPEAGGSEEGVYLTSKKPSKIGIKNENSIWITNSGGGYSEDMMPFEVIDIIGRKIEEGHDLIIVGIEHLFQDWEPQKFYTYFKLLVDICAKHGRKIIIAPWKNVNQKIREIVEIYM